MFSQNKKFIIVVIFSAAVIIGLAIGGYYFFKGEKKVKTTEKIDISYHQAKGEEIKNIDEIKEETKLLYAERVVIGFDANGNNIYQTNFYLTDLRGEKKYKFYSTDDLTYEMAYPFLENNILILTEFGQQENRVINLEGFEEEETFIPPVGFGQDFIVSKNKKFIAYLENVVDNQSSPAYKYTLRIKDIENDKSYEYDPEKIKHQEVEFSQIIPLAFSTDNRTLYIFATSFGMDLDYQKPNGLYALKIFESQVDELYFSSQETTPEKDLIVLLGVFPENNIALVNRGPQIADESGTTFRTQLQNLDLTTKEFKDILIDENKDLAGLGGQILSPDNQKLILLNNAYYDEGLRLYDIQKKSTKELTDKGEFIAWDKNSKLIIYRVFVIKQIKDQMEQQIELHTLNLETGEDYKIFTQTVTDEGTGLNKEGDSFYIFIGVI